MNTTFNDLFYNYMARGILQSNIPEDGGLQCYHEIPIHQHYAFVVVLTIVHLTLLIKYRKHLEYETTVRDPSKFETRFAWVSFLSWLLTVFFKLKTMKGLFMLNPCHITILIQIYLLLKPNTRFNRILYTAWSGWLFGAYMATFIPHLNGITEFEVFLYYFQHIAIIPCGYLVLAWRYGFPKPTIKNHLAAFSTIALWQFWVLVPFSRAYMVNLNFALCHSPADPSFKVVGHYYFVACTIFLNLFAYLLRWLSWLQVKIVYGALSVFGINQAKITPTQTDPQYDTPGGDQTQ